MGLRLGSERVLRGDGRGQTAPLGVALVMGIVIVGTASVLVFGGAALDDTQSQSELSRAEQIMTLFDSRTAMVALGDSDVQTTNFPGGGTHTVDGDAGRIRIVHVDYNGTHDETVYDAPMGAVIFERGDTEFAYQGGGVWRKDRSGEARMVTPPEFHYRQSTLTFPLVRIGNDDSASGAATAKATAVQRAVPIYPNRTAAADAAEDNNPETGAPYDPVGASSYEEPYHNPLENGSVAVWVESRYYEAWATYFRERTDAQVTTFDSNNTVRADLISLGDRGKFDMPNEGNGIRVSGLAGNGHSLQNFSFVLKDDPNDQAKFNNLKWSMYVENGQKELEFHVRSGGKIDGDDYLKLSVYYSWDGGDTYHGWTNNTAFKVQSGDVDDDGDSDNYAFINLTSTDQKLEASSLKDKDVVQFDNPNNDKLGDFNGNNTQLWEAHEGTVSWERELFDPGDKTTVYNVSAHYMEVVGDSYELVVDDKESQTVHEDSSHGRIQYPGSAKYIAYLHVTENEVTVSFN